MNFISIVPATFLLKTRKSKSLEICNHVFLSMCTLIGRSITRCDPNCSYLNTSSVTLKNPEFCRTVSIEDFRKIDRCCCVMVSEQSMEEFLGMLLYEMGAEPRPFQNVQSI